MSEQSRNTERRRGAVNRRTRARWIFATVLWMSGPGLALGQAPDLSGVSDILLGKRELARVDDIGITVVQSGNVQRSYLPTQNGTAGASAALLATIPTRDNTERFLIERFFDLDKDTVLTNYRQSSGLDALEIVDHNRASYVQSLVFEIENWAAGDFTGDGYQDLVVVGAPGAGNYSLSVASAFDVGDLMQGFNFGDSVDIPSNGQPGAGDFDGDGRDEIAIATEGCGSGSGFTLQIYTVNPVSLQLTARGSTCVQPPSNVGTALRIPVAGRFAPATAVNLAAGKGPPEQLALVFGNPVDGTTHSAAFATFTVDPDTFTPTQRGTNSSGGSAFSVHTINGGLLKPQAGFIAGNGFINPNTRERQQTEILIVTVQPPTNLAFPYPRAYAFDESLHVIRDIDTNSGSSGNLCGLPGLDVALGSFATALEDPPSSDLQLAVAFRCNDDGHVGIHVAEFGDPENLDLSLHYGSVQKTGLSASWDSIDLVTGDIQGRSLILDDPVVLRFAVRQPDLILGAPPMHVDYVTPIDEGEPTDLNMSAIVFSAAGFSASFDTAVEDTNQSSTSSTTSYSTAVNVGGDIDAELERHLYQLDATLETSIENEYESTVETNFDTYTGAGIDASFETGFRDLLYFQNRRLNVFAYPIIGESGCPASNPDCTSAEERPLYVLYSAIDRIQPVKANLDAIEWYQPAHEPGNVLSYPATPELLNAGRALTNPDFDLFTSALTSVQGLTFTDDSVETVSYDWSAGGSTDQSVGSSATQSGDVSASFSDRVGRKKASGVEATLEGGLETHDSVETLQASTQEIGASSGIEVSKPPTFREPSHYQYAYHGIVFGSPFPIGTAHTPEVSGDLQSTGALELAFLADPTTTSPRSGDWWSSSDGYRSAPDVALNHPKRWDTFQSSGSVNDTCLPASSGGTNLSCVEFQEPPDFGEDCEDLGCIWTNNFLKMRGFFVTAPGSETGPQINTAVAGSQLDLQVRVYNYSLTAMDPGTEVHVRFYAQPWNPRINVADGPSFLIDEVTHAPIPRFGSVSLNWDMVRTTFDTTGLEERWLIFWVVVWMEDESGELVEEIEGHGLTAIPGELVDISEVPFEERSNNVGFYNSVFVILPSDEFDQARLSGTVEEEGRLVLEDVRVEPDRARLHEQVDVVASVRAEDEEAEATLVTFHHGNPDDGAEIFDIEHIALIRADDSHEARVGFRPRTCGTHELFVSVDNLGGTSTEGARQAVLLEVDCDSPPVGGSDEDDGCEIAAGGPSSTAWFVLLAGLIAFTLRPRRRKPVRAIARADRRR